VKKGIFYSWRDNLKENIDAEFNFFF